MWANIAKYLVKVALWSVENQDRLIPIIEAVIVAKNQKAAERAKR